MADLTQTLTDTLPLLELVDSEWASTLADTGVGLADPTPTGVGIVADPSVDDDLLGLSDTVLVEFLEYVTDAGVGLTDPGDTRGVEDTLDDDTAGMADETTPSGGSIAPPTVGDPAVGVAVLDTATLAGGVVWLYGLQESQGSSTAGDVSGAPGRPGLTMVQSGTGGEYEFGASGLMPEGTALRLAAEAPGSGWTLRGTNVSAYLGAEWALWCQFAWTGGAGARLVQIGGFTLTVTASTVRATIVGPAGATSTVTVTTATGDNHPHMAVVSMVGGSLWLTVDDEQATVAGVAGLIGTVQGLVIGSADTTNPHQVAWVGYANAGMPPARALELGNLGSGGSERSDLRVARICRWLGVDPDLVAETGLSDVAYQATGDQQALDLIAAVNEVEDGVFFPAGDGTLRQHSRDHRYDAPVRIALPATDVNPDLAVQVDLARVVNDLAVSRPSGATYRARNQTSIDAYGPRVDARTLYAASDDDLRLAAEWRLARYGTPAPRIPSVTVNLLAADEATARAVLGLEVGDRIQVTGMPDTTPGGTTVDLFVEGFDEALSATDWRVTLATSPWFDVRTGVLDTAELGDVLLAY